MVALLLVGTLASVDAADEARFCVTIRSDEPIEDGDLLAAVEAGEATVVIEAASACAEPVPTPGATPFVIDLLPPTITGTSSEVFASLAVSSEQPDGYDRDLFPHWIDADGDGCDARREVLISESLTPVTIGFGCGLSGGSWESLFDGLMTSNPGDLHIDHLVPLAEAWRSGARDWTPQRRTDFANDLADPRSLIAVSGTSNISKSDRDPAGWLPPEADYHCQYVHDWVAVKARWDLTVDPDEAVDIDAVLAGCPDTEMSVERAEP